jgi:hypothetical protein
MRYDEGLAQRLRELLAGESGVTEKKMLRPPLPSGA